MKLHYPNIDDDFHSRYHAQDESGQASYGFTTAEQSQSHIRDAEGNQIGHYSYINQEGQEVVVFYTAGHGGFRVLSNSLPTAPAVAPAANSQSVSLAPVSLVETLVASVPATAQQQVLAIQQDAHVLPVTLAIPAPVQQQTVILNPDARTLEDLSFQSLDANKDGEPDKLVAAFRSAVELVPQPSVIPSLTLQQLQDLADQSLDLNQDGQPDDFFGSRIVITQQPMELPSLTLQQLQDLMDKSLDLNQDGQPDEFRHTVVSIAPQPVVLSNPTAQQLEDLANKSLDLNQDGQPDELVGEISPALVSSAQPVSHQISFQ